MPLKWFFSHSSETDAQHQRMASDPDIMAESLVSSGKPTTLIRGALAIPPDHVPLNIINRAHRANWATAAL